MSYNSPQDCFQRQDYNKSMKNSFLIQESNISQDSAYHSRYGSSNDMGEQYSLHEPYGGAQVHGRYPSWPEEQLPPGKQLQRQQPYEVEETLSPKTSRKIFKDAAFRNNVERTSHLDDTGYHLQREFGSQYSVLFNKNDIHDKGVVQPLPQRAKSFSYSRQMSPLQMASSNDINRNMMNGLSSSNEGFSVKIKPCYNTTTQTDEDMDEMRMKIELREARDNNLRISSSSVESKMIQTNMRPLSHSASHGQLQGLKNFQNDDAFRLNQHQNVISIQKRIDSDISTRVSELSESSQSGAVRMCEDMNQLSQASMIRRLSKELYGVGVMNRLSSRSERQPRLGSIDETTQSHDLSNYNERMNQNMRRSSSERDEQNLRRSGTSYDNSISDDHFQSSYDHPHQSSLEISESNELSPNAMTTDGSNFVRNRKSQMSLRKAFGIYDEFDAIERNPNSLKSNDQTTKMIKKMTDVSGLYEQSDDMKTFKAEYTYSQKQKDFNSKTLDYPVEMRVSEENQYSPKIGSNNISSALYNESQTVANRGQKQMSATLTPFDMTSSWQGRDDSYADDHAFRSIRDRLVQSDVAATAKKKSASLPPNSALSISDESARQFNRMSSQFQEVVNQNEQQDCMVGNRHESHVTSVGLQPSSNYHHIHSDENRSSTMQSNFPSFDDSSTSSPPPSLPPRQYRKGSAGMIFRDSPSVETDSVLFSSNDFDYDSTIKRDIYAQQLRQQAKRLSHSNTSIVSTGRAYRQLVQPIFDENRTSVDAHDIKLLLLDNEAVHLEKPTENVAENSSSSAIMISENIWNDSQQIGTNENTPFLHGTWTGNTSQDNDVQENSEEILLLPSNVVKTINISVAVDNSEISCTDGALIPFHSSCSTDGAFNPFHSSCSTDSALNPFHSSCSTDGALDPFYSSCSTDSALNPFHSSCSTDGALNPFHSSGLLLDKSANNHQAIDISKNVITENNIEFNLNSNHTNLNVTLSTCDALSDRVKKVKHERNALTNQLKQEEEKEKKSKKKTEPSNLLSDNQRTSKQNNTVDDNKEKNGRRLLKTSAADDDDRAALNASKIDRRLSNSLFPFPDHKTAAYYMTGLFDEDDVIQSETFNRYSVQRASLRNHLFDARQTEEHNTDERDSLSSSRKHESLVMLKASCIQQSRLEKEKVELMCKLEKNLETLKQERQLLDEEISENNELGQKVTSIVEQRLEAKEFGKYKLYVDELEKVLYLLLKLSDRLAKAENAILCLPQNASDKEKESLIFKRNELSEKHSDAKSLKEGIDRRRHQVSGYLEKCLSSEEFKDYEYFVKMKTQLVIEQQEIEDMIELGKKQLDALKSTLCNFDDLKSSDC